MGMISLKWSLRVVAAFIFAAPAAAEQGPMPEDIAWKLVEIGRVIDPPKTAALYAPLQQKEPYQGVKVERNIRYGPADLNTLDVFVSETAPKGHPVLIFVRGGGFVGGDKHAQGSPFYDNVMLWAVKNAFVGVNINYRLAPQSPWPAGAEDVAGAVRWVADNIAARGGDPAHIFLMGHSAGAVHVATYVAHPEFHELEGGGIEAAMLVSGFYDFTDGERSAPERAYLGTDPAQYGPRSSLQGLLATRIPMMIATAELDPEAFSTQFELLRNATCKGVSGCARFLFLPQHSHMSEVYSINTADTRLTDQILEFVKSGK
jgi:acetyl esterase/lipase